LAALSEDAVEDLQLALGEALANAVEHAYRDQPPGDCTYAVSWLPDGGVDVRVEDFGTWRPVPADPGFRGRGLRLIRELSEDAVLEPSPSGGTSVRFRIPVRPAGRKNAVSLPRAAQDGGDGTARLVREDGALRLTGELDLISTGDLRTQLLAEVDAAGDAPVELDLRGLGYLASAGVGLLVEAVERARIAGGRLRVVVDPRGSVARVLTLSGLEAMISEP
jgi:anti-anti-sigma factor